MRQGVSGALFMIYLMPSLSTELRRSEAGNRRKEAWIRTGHVFYTYVIFHVESRQKPTKMSHEQLCLAHAHLMLLWDPVPQGLELSLQRESEAGLYKPAHLAPSSRRGASQGPGCTTIQRLCSCPGPWWGVSTRWASLAQITLLHKLWMDIRRRHGPS